MKKPMLRIATGFILFLGSLHTASAACPVYEAPACTAKENVVVGKDANNCPMPMCQGAKENCPNYVAPVCAAGEHLATSPDPANKKCRKPVCETPKSAK